MTNNEKFGRVWPAEWVDFKTTPPTEQGYYYLLYKHKDGQEYAKAIWWNGTEFRYKDYVTEPLEYLPNRFDFYVPAMNWALGREND